MSYVIYDIDTTRITLRPKNSNRWTTAAAACAAITRAIKKGTDCSNMRISESQEFFNTIEKKEIRKGIAGSAGKTFEVSVNTPWTSGPWSESWWSN